MRRLALNLTKGMHMNTKGKIAALTLVSLAACAHAEGGGGLLTTSSGMTVYTFDKDAEGKSNCAGQCLAIWPAVLPGGISGAAIGSTTRDDGGKQATFKGKPIYLFAGDSKPGDANGDNMENVWHVVPLGVKNTAPRRDTSGGGYRGYGY